MDPLHLHRVADAATAGLRGSEVSQPFGPGADVYKVAGKMFMFLGEHTGDPMVTLKADPEDGLALCQAHHEITPGYHMNKRHWISVVGGDTVDEDLLRDLIRTSYLLVVASLPRRLRPMTPPELRA